MRQLLSAIRRGRVIQKLKCDLSPGSVGDPATGALPSSLKAPTNLSGRKKLVAMVSRRIVMICWQELLCIACCYEFNAAPSAFLVTAPGRKNVSNLYSKQVTRIYTDTTKMNRFFLLLEMWFCPNPIEARRSCLCVHSKNMWRTGECGRRSFVSDSAVIFNSSPMCSSNQNRMFLIKWTRKYLFMQLTLMWQMKRSVTQRFHHDAVGIKKRSSVFVFHGRWVGGVKFLIWSVAFMTLSFFAQSNRLFSIFCQ